MHARVLKPDEIALHMVVMPHPAPPDDELHHQLVANGYRPGTYHEGPTVNRTYWKQLEAEPGAG